MTGTPIVKRSLLEYMLDRRPLQVQPEVDLASRRLVAAEVIGACVFGEAASAAAGLRAIRPSFRLWFNVTADDLADPQWLDRTARAGSSLRGLGVEITQAVAMRHLPETLRALATLKRAGFSVALDDFGSGYPVLAAFRHIPIDVVKLSGSVTARFPDDVRQRRIVGAIVSLGRRFGFKVVARGVESSEQARALRDAGCHYGQGSYFGRPMTVHELLAPMTERTALAS
jgi:EAL domain-containing protein (putative c-di-GMP-specific phosphodiesterase class I)